MAAKRETDGEPQGDARADRRDRRRQAQRDRVRKHGARLAEIYRNSILKRLRKPGSAGR